jgi:ethanolamine ammonia-lyase small subunit
MSAKPTPPVIDNPWRQLRRFTDARIALGRAGVSVPTQPYLEFQLAHAQARDAVHLPLDAEGLVRRLTAGGYPSLRLHSSAPDRTHYLQRPDLGRRLDRPSRARLAQACADDSVTFDLAFVIADGLSALAVHHHAVSFLDAITPMLRQEGWSIAPLVLVEQGRVAIGDEVAAVMRAEMVAVLIGERPGLSSPDSLGVYFTYHPHPGCSDAERNCLSNIRLQGLPYAVAAHKLHYLMCAARRRKLSGVNLKDEAEASAESPVIGTGTGNFLTEH